MTRTSRSSAMPRGSGGSLTVKDQGWQGAVRGGKEDIGDLGSAGQLCHGSHDLLSSDGLPRRYRRCLGYTHRGLDRITVGTFTAH